MTLGVESGTIIFTIVVDRLMDGDWFAFGTFSSWKFGEVGIGERKGSPVNNLGQ